MIVKSAIQFLREVRVELSKVDWPGFQEFSGATVVVLVLVCCFAVYLGVIDLGLSKLFKYVFTTYGGY